VILEIIAEGKVPQHLEEGVMARGIADVFQIVMLAAGANAFLGRGRPAVVALFHAGEDVLELDHPGVGEHERRIVARHERTRGDDRVAVGSEIVEKGSAEFVSGLTSPQSGLFGRAFSAGAAFVPISAKSGGNPTIQQAFAGAKPWLR